MPRHGLRAPAAVLCLTVCSFAAAQAPRHLVVTPVQEQGQHRDWVEQPTGAWLESSADGHRTRFTVTEKKSMLHGVSGVTMIDPGHRKVFIPDAGDTGPYAKVMYFIDLAGDTGEWQVLGIFTEQP